MGSMLNIPSRMEGPEQKTIIGKPEITVSSKGIANGKSVYLNDGADFGPDTKLGAATLGQYGPPFSSTWGISEAAKYMSLLNSRGGTVKLNSGDYFDPPFGSISLPGFADSSQAVYLDGNGATWNNPNASYTSISLATSGLSLIDIRNLTIFNHGGVGVDISNASSSAQRAVLENIYCFMSGTGATAFKVNSSSYLLNCSTNPTGILEMIAGAGPVYVENGLYGQVTGACQQVVFKNTGFIGSTQPLIITGGPSSSNTPLVIIFDSCYFDGSTTNDIVDINVQLASTTPIYVKFKECIFNGFSGKYMVGSTTSPTTKMNLTLIVEGGSNTGTGLIDFNPSYFTATSKIYGITGNSITRSAQLQPTTPAVPASGTAQSNTNNYPVNVYIYGGTVTVIDYTPSNGSAIQIGTTGPVTVRLEPGDSITLTYSAAPSWNWVSA